MRKKFYINILNIFYRNKILLMKKTNFYIFFYYSLYPRYMGQKVT